MEPKEMCEQLLKALLSVSEYNLNKNHQFQPIGAVMRDDNTIVFTELDIDSQLTNKQIVDLLIQAHKERASDYNVVASGIAYDSTIEKADGVTTDAIVISLEHRYGYSTMMVEPYRFGIFKNVKFGQMFAQRGNHNIF